MYSAVHHPAVHHVASKVSVMSKYNKARVAAIQAARRPWAYKQPEPEPEVTAGAKKGKKSAQSNEPSNS